MCWHQREIIRQKNYIIQLPILASLIVYITDWELHLLVINLKGSIHYFIKNIWYKYTGTVHSKCINDHTLRSDIFLLKCLTHSREMSDKFESQHSLSPTIWSDIVVGRESGYLKILFTFLEVNMSNILWSMRICKRTFFPVCRMSGYVNTLVYFDLAPYSHQERYLKGHYITEILLKSDV